MLTWDSKCKTQPAKSSYNYVQTEFMYHNKRSIKML